jgi:Ni,Fe-hydrogenase III large subunit
MRKIKNIKLGPKSCVFEEPFIAHLKTKGNKIVGVEFELGFLHRGIERLATRKNFYQNLGLVERICGYCSFTHSLAYTQAVEDAAGIKAPPRALYIRTIVAELERLHSHLLWLYLEVNKIGFGGASAYLVQLREGILSLLVNITGGRIMYEINTFGGVLKDTPNLEDAEKQTRVFADIAKRLVVLFEENKAAKELTSNKGILTYKKAIELGAVGPTARASGIKVDVRKDEPYAAYGELLSKDYTILFGGDVYSRIYLRFIETAESFELIHKAIKNIPAGDIKLPGGSIFVPAGEGIGRVEAPRGELFHFIKTDSSNNPMRLKVKPPTYNNLPAVGEMLIGANKEDASLIISSIDPCFSCTER